jgi:hypothetical protein
MTDPDTRGWRTSPRRHDALVCYVLTWAMVAGVGRQRLISGQPLLGNPASSARPGILASPDC